MWGTTIEEKHFSWGKSLRNNFVSSKFLFLKTVSSFFSPKSKFTQKQIPQFFSSKQIFSSKMLFLRDVSIKYVMHDILYRMQHLSLQERAAFSATVCLRRCGKIVMHILMRSRDGAWAQYTTHLAGNRVRSLRNLTLFATSRLLFCSSPVSVWGWSAPFTLMHFLCMGGGWA